MSIPTRAEALATLEEGWSAIGALMDGLSSEQASEAATIGGGDWSAKDLVGHLAFWEELAVEALQQRRAGDRPRIEDVFDKGADGIDAINAENHARTSAQTLEEVQARAAASRDAIVKAIWSMNDAEWHAKPPYETSRRQLIAELLGAVLGAPKQPFGHAFAHLPDLKARVDALG